MVMWWWRQPLEGIRLIFVIMHVFCYLTITYFPYLRYTVQQLNSFINININLHTTDKCLIHTYMNTYSLNLTVLVILWITKLCCPLVNRRCIFLEFFFMHIHTKIVHVVYAPSKSDRLEEEEKPDTSMFL